MTTTKLVMYEFLEWVDECVFGCRIHFFCNWILYGEFWDSVRFQSWNRIEKKDRQADNKEVDNLIDEIMQGRGEANDE